ncbi:MAG TPA: protein phosphatase 2C domain-containing protein [Bryobacteraceae bacterium]|jgi:protein phosphatase|nr:protein phosphatase 2C domain-containing protein [Bryobacteraceae bacterium]
MIQALRDLAGRLRKGPRRESDAAPGGLARLKVEGAARTDPGRERAANEDSVGWFEAPDTAALRTHGRLALVADGMGGAHGGAIASGLALSIIRERYFAGGRSAEANLRTALEGANRAIYQRARREPELEGMGATCLAVAILDTEIRAAWVGDSRLYLVRDGGIYQLTEDHSVVAEMVRAGRLTREEARNHESRNVITRALGTKASEEIGGWPAAFDARPGDRLLLCSDGVHDPLEDQELLCLMAGKGPDQAAAALIAGANARGGHDNASAVVVDFLDAAPKTPKATRILQTLRGARS